MSKMTKTIAALGVVAGLGVAALPLSSYADAQINVTATVTNDISVTTVDSEVALGPVSNNGGISAKSTTIKVNTNSAGYNLNIAGVGDKTTLDEVNADGLPVADGGSIAAGDLTSTTASQWGYRVNEDASYTGIIAGGASLLTNVPAATIDTTITFGVKAVNSQPGTYKGGVIITATAVDTLPASN